MASQDIEANGLKDGFELEKTSPASVSSDAKSTGIFSHSKEAAGVNNGLHYVRRGQEIVDNPSTDSITGYDADQMRARASLTYDEEKKLLRRIDWHIMPLCAFAFLLKNLDASNVTNAKIMNTGTPDNILTQLGMTANEFNFVSTIYYVGNQTLLEIFDTYE